MPSDSDFHDFVNEALRIAFGMIDDEFHRSPTHLDMELRFNDGEVIHAKYLPISEGGSGKIEIS